MTETPQADGTTAGPQARPAARRGPLPPRGVAVPALALATFFGAFSVMSLRMGAGDDPALGSGTKASTPAPPAKRVLVRRIVKKTVILPPREPAAMPAGGGAGPVPAPASGGGVSAAAAPSSGGGGGGGSSAPASPVRASAPSPAPAPAAAPAPAPVTRSS